MTEDQRALWLALGIWNLFGWIARGGFLVK